MLRQVADGVLIHESEFCQSNAVVVQGRAGVLLIDPGVQGHEMACLANDLRELGQPVVTGFSTHPHWDHLLWHARLGAAPRYSTARGAATVRDRLSDAGAKARVAALIPPDIAEQVPLDLLGLITGLPAETAQIPWDGPQVRIIEHQAHAPGHAALLIEERGVLVAGDMLSDVLIPMLDLNDTADPIEDYLAALRLLEGAADDVDVLVPGHGSIGGSDQVPARIDQDRAYVHALRDAHVLSDPRVGPSAKDGWDWVAGVHERQLRHLARTRRARRDARIETARDTTRRCQIHDSRQVSSAGHTGHPADASSGDRATRRPCPGRVAGSRCGAGSGLKVAWTAHDDEFRLAIGHQLWRSSLQRESTMSSSMVNFIAITVRPSGARSSKPC